MAKCRSKSAMVTTEVAVGIALAVVVLFVVIGLFNSNISTMISNNKIANMFKGNDSKTEYESFNRNYSESQVDVQIMGEQGLSMLRRKANNKALELIEAQPTSANINGDSIAYLALVIQSVTTNHSPNICVYMDKDSDDPCESLDGNKYKITNLTSSALTVVETKPNGTAVGSPVTIKVDDAVREILSSSTLPSTDGTSTEITKEVYYFIRNLSTKLKTELTSDVLVVRPAKSVNDTSANYGEESATTVVLVKEIGLALSQAYQGCLNLSTTSGSRYCTPIVSLEDYNNYNTWSNAYVKARATLVASMANASLDERNQAVVELFVNDYLKKNDIINIINDDVYLNNSKTDTACDILNEKLEYFHDEYGVTIPQCVAGK